MASWDNLLTAYQRCQRRKRYRQPATKFDFQWEQKTCSACSSSYSMERIDTAAITTFTSLIPSLEKSVPLRFDRVVHHALVNVLEPLFEARFIFDSYACRVGKGTHRAIRRAQHYQRRFPWCLQTDIVKFFPNIDHQILLQTIQRPIS